MCRKIFIATFDNDAIEVIRENKIGIELNEICISDMLDEEKFNDTVSFMKAQIKNSGAEDVIMHGPFTEIVPASIDHRMLDAGFVRLEEAYRACEILGVKKMVVHSGYMPPLYQKGWHTDRSVEFWTKFMEDKPEDFNIYIENVLEDEPFMMKELVERINDKRVRLCLDIGHANWSGAEGLPVKNWIKELGPYLAHFHFHNNFEKSDEHNAIHNGTMDMDEILEAVYTYCAEDITITIESHECRESAKWLKKYIENH